MDPRAALAKRERTVAEFRKGAENAEDAYQSELEDILSEEAKWSGLGLPSEVPDWNKEENPHEPH